MAPDRGSRSGPARSIENVPRLRIHRGPVRPEGRAGQPEPVLTYRYQVPPRPPPLAAAAPLAVGGGLLAWAAFPGTSWWWAAPVAVAALMLAVRGRRPAAAGALGALFGAAFLLPLLQWTGLQVGWLPWLVLCAMEALFLAAAGVLLACVQRLDHPALRVPGAAAAWVAVEAAQARLPFGGFGWSRLAFSQSEAPTLGLSAVGGAPLVSFAVALTGAALLEGLLAARGRRWPVLAAAAATAVVAVLSGLAVPTPADAESGTVRVAGVQGNVPQMGMEFNAERRAVLNNHAGLTQTLATSVDDGRSAAPDLVIWPENSSDIDPLANADAERVISAAVTAVDAPTLVGTLVRGDDDRTTNTTLLWLPEQGPVQSYDKRHPVPFAEYVPHRDFFRRITPLVDQAGNFAAGDAPGLFQVPTPAGELTVGALICFEVVDDDLVADIVDGGAEIIVVQTNNATFGFSDESVQQLAMSRLRAVETGRAVAHVSTVGVSALIAPDGAVLVRAPLFEPALLEADLPRRSTLTLASRLGAWPEGLLTVGGILGALCGALAGRRQAEGTP